MNSHVQINLALILFLPWYAILAGLFWAYPRQPRTVARRLFDAGALAAAVGASVLAMHWGFLSADTSVGVLWKQVLATSVSYGAFLGAMTLAWVVRRALMPRLQARAIPIPSTGAMP